MEYQICSRCIMDTSDTQITFDNEGVCNHCLRYFSLKDLRTIPPETAAEEMQGLINKIRLKGKNSNYDCIVGVSGGVDSTYVAYLAKQNGLRPLAVHLDNGWNSDLATANIHKVLNKLDIDLVTHVIDWEEFKNLQKSFLEASVPDGEIPTDHAIDAILWKTADKYNIKYILSGMNFATESMSVPTWAYGHSDWKYIRAIHKIFKNTSLKTYPRFSFMYLFYVTFIKNVRIVSLLNYIQYDKFEAMKILERELGWVSYGGKHYESIYTRFYQGFILPEKFNIDKRRGHLSDLINSNQITRKEALIEIDQPALSQEMLREDKQFFMKKMDQTQKDFDDFMASPNMSFTDYPNSYKFVQFLRGLVNMLRKFGIYPK